MRLSLLPTAKVCWIRKKLVQSDQRLCSFGIIPIPFSPQHLLLAVLTRGKAWKTDHVQWYTWTLGGRVEEWHCKVAFWTQEMSPRLSDVQHSVILRSMLVISSALTYLWFCWGCAIPPHVQYHSSTRPVPFLHTSSAIPPHVQCHSSTRPVPFFHTSSTIPPHVQCHSSTRPPNVQVRHCTWSVLSGLPPH